MYKLTDYDYHLPENLIAQNPAPNRDASRLLILNRFTGKLRHQTFRDLDQFLTAGDILVLNNTEVIPARLRGRKTTGGKVEAFILDYHQAAAWEEGSLICRCLIKASKQPPTGSRLYFNDSLEAQVLEFKDGVYTLKFEYRGDFEIILDRIGHVPLPPYIKRQAQDRLNEDRHRYQTVYANTKGAVAAPTAGLHFTEDLLDRLKNNGIKVVEITLHVGYGTFLPVRAEDIRDHRIHSEWYSVKPHDADLINHAKAAGNRIVAVGTTSVRTLEYASSNAGRLCPGQGACDLFIYPGYQFKMVDVLITNFHLPKSSLIMLVAAFAGRDNILEAYQEAIRHGYRFYSYGDAMLIY